jgi:hypothetical protein
MVLEKPVEKLEMRKIGKLKMQKGSPRRSGVFLLNTSARCHFVSIGTVI